MKKIFLILLLFISLSSICQKIKISEMPTVAGNGSGAYIPIVQGLQNYKILVDSLLSTLVGKLLYLDTVSGLPRLNVDSLKLEELFGGGGGSTNPAGLNRQIQFNENSAFGADSNFVWNRDSSILRLGNTGVYSNLATIMSGYIAGTGGYPSGIGIVGTDAPAGTNYSGGPIEIRAGAGDGSSGGSGQGVGITGGSGGNTGQGGPVTITGGGGGESAGNGGSVNITAGGSSGGGYVDGFINLITNNSVVLGGGAATVSVNSSYALPPLDGTANQIMKTNGLGTLTWSTPFTVFTGTAPPTITPSKVGDEYVDTVNKKIYFSTGTSSSADWTIVN